MTTVNFGSKNYIITDQVLYKKIWCSSTWCGESWQNSINLWLRAWAGVISSTHTALRAPPWDFGSDTNDTTFWRLWPGLRVIGFPVSASVPFNDDGIPWRRAWVPEISTLPGCWNVMASTSGLLPHKPVTATPNCTKWLCHIGRHPILELHYHVLLGELWKILHLLTERHRSRISRKK